MSVQHRRLCILEMFGDESRVTDLSWYGGNHKCPGDLQHTTCHTNISHDSVLVIQRINPSDFGETNVVMDTDPLVLSVLQPYGVVSHTQQCDDEVDQSEDAVEPQKAVPVRHKNMSVTYTPSPIQCFSNFLCYFNTSDVIHKVSDLLCTHVSQCCPSKVFRTVSCRNNAT